MKCPYCERELIPLNINFSENEMMPFSGAYSAENIAATCLNPKNLKKIGFQKENLYNYVRDNLRLLGNSNSVEFLLRKETSEKLNIPFSFTLFSGDLYLEKSQDCKLGNIRYIL